MLTQDQLKICDELVELYRAQLKFVETTAAKDWTLEDVERYDQRAERIANLQRQFMRSINVDRQILKTTHTIRSGSWRDR